MKKQIIMLTVSLIVSAPVFSMNKKLDLELCKKYYKKLNSGESTRELEWSVRECLDDYPNLGEIITAERTRAEEDEYRRDERRRAEESRRRSETGIFTYNQEEIRTHSKNTNKLPLLALVGRSKPNHDYNEKNATASLSPDEACQYLGHKVAVGSKTFSFDDSQVNDLLGMSRPKRKLFGSYKPIQIVRWSDDINHNKEYEFATMYVDLKCKGQASEEELVNSEVKSLLKLSPSRSIAVVFDDSARKFLKDVNLGVGVGGTSGGSVSK